MPKARSKTRAPCAGKIASLRKTLENHDKTRSDEACCGA